MKIFALVPAHNEQKDIVRTIESIKLQSHRVDEIIVIADNCTDETVPLAKYAGATVIETVDNTAKKAGALNYGLDTIVHNLNPDDYVLMMDADSFLAPDFIQIALEYFTGDVGGLSGSVVARETENICETLQAMEYSRGVRTTARSKGRVNVLSGAATILSAKAIWSITNARGSYLPGEKGKLFLEDSLTEDYELTLAMRQLGFKAIATFRARVITDVMPTWAALRKQRMRWQRGTLESIWEYRKFPVSRRGKILQTFYYTASLLFPLTLIAYGLMLTMGHGHIMFNYLWLVVYAIAGTVSVVDSWQAGVKGRLLAGMIFPSYIYENYLMFIYWKALWHTFWQKSDRSWHS